LVQDQGGIAFQAAGILEYFEELKRNPNTDIGPKDIFETASNLYGNRLSYSGRSFSRLEYPDIYRLFL